MECQETREGTHDSALLDTRGHFSTRLFTNLHFIVDLRNQVAVHSQITSDCSDCPRKDSDMSDNQNAPLPKRQKTKGGLVLEELGTECDDENGDGEHDDSSSSTSSSPSTRRLPPIRSQRQLLTNLRATSGATSSTNEDESDETTSSSGSEDSDEEESSEGDESDDQKTQKVTRQGSRVSPSTRVPNSNLFDDRSDLKSRLQHFLPQLRHANAELGDLDNTLNKRIDHVPDDSEHYIEMTLGLGVLSEQKREAEEPTNLRSLGTEDDDEEDVHVLLNRTASQPTLEHDIMARLKGETVNQGTKRKVEELG